MIFEIIAPYFAEIKSGDRVNTKYHPHHIEERLGLLTIIVLDEIVLSSVLGIKELYDHFNIEMLNLVASSFIIMFSMWWLYFDLEVGKRLKELHVAFIWSYGHFFIFSSIASVGALIGAHIELFQPNANFHISKELLTFFLSIAVAVFLFSVWLTQDNFIRKNIFCRLELVFLSIVIIFIWILRRKCFTYKSLAYGYEYTKACSITNE